MGANISMFLLSSDGKTRLHIPVVNQANEEDKNNRKKSVLDGPMANHRKFIEYVMENGHTISSEEFAGISGRVDEGIEDDVNMRYWRKY